MRGLQMRNSANVVATGSGGRGTKNFNEQKLPRRRTSGGRGKTRLRKNPAAIKSQSTGSPLIFAQSGVMNITETFDYLPNGVARRERPMRGF